jgi:hypothetical protein
MLFGDLGVELAPLTANAGDPVSVRIVDRGDLVDRRP